MMASDDTMRDAAEELGGRKALYGMVLGGGCTLLSTNGRFSGHMALNGEGNLELMAVDDMHIAYRIVLRTDGAWSSYIQFSE